MYYLNLDSQNYLLSIAATPLGDGGPQIESLEGLDFSGVRANAYHWNGNELILDEDRLRELEKEHEEKEKEFWKEQEYQSALLQVQSMLATEQINTLSVDDDTALRWKFLYPEWTTNVDYEKDVKVQYQDRLYKCLQKNTSQIGWEPTNVPALWTEINETHKGTIDDPIPYNGNMALENGKYYSQNDVKYHCTRDTINPVYHPLAELVGLYVEIVQ